MLSKATIIGRSHRLRQQNSHDFACITQPVPGVTVGLVLDGCGSSFVDRTPSHNEVGAKLLGQFVAAILQQRLAAVKKIDRDMLAPLLQQLPQKCVSFLGQICHTLPGLSESAQARFLSTHLLTTLLGFVVSPQTAAFFWQGDGCLVANGDITLVECDNAPDYLAYQVLAARAAVGHTQVDLSAAPPSRAAAESGWHVRFVDRHQLRWLAVATDGWQPAQLSQLSTPRSSLQLQRWLNVAARQPGVFEDDGAVSVFWLAS